MKKLLKGIGIALLLLVVLPLAVVMAINAFDDKLDAKAAAAGEPRAAAVPEAENGYLALLAMNAGDGTDGAVYAKAWLAEARAAAKENRSPKAIEAKRARRLDLCNPAQVSCLAAVQDPAKGIAAKLDAYKEDLERYEKLIASRAYEEIQDYVFDVNTPIPNYAIGVQRVYLVRAALAVQDGKIEEALSAVERDLAFDRLMLAGSRSLIGRMVAAAKYRMDLAFVADLMQTRAADLKPFAPRLTEMLKPIAPAALRLDDAFDTEFGAVKHMLKNPATVESLGPSGVLGMIGARFFYKPNATINKAYGNYMQIAELSRRPPAVLLVQNAQKPLPGSEDLKFWDYIDNPMGNILLLIAMPSFGAYPLRLHDLDAYNRLLGLGAEIIAAGVSAEDVADFVAKSDARFRNPYSGKPMEWDAGTKQLSCKECDSRRDVKAFSTDGKGRVFLQM